MEPYSGRVQSVSPHGVAVQLDYRRGAAYPNGTFVVQVHEAYDPGITGRGHQPGDSIRVVPRAGDVDSTLDWRESR